MAVAVRFALALLALAAAAHGAAAAGRPSGAAGRELLQSGVSCPEQIPGCTPRRCTSRILNSTEMFVCLRCQRGSVPVLGSDSRSIVQCICPPGSYWLASSRTCSACGAGHYCPGGKRNARLADDDLGTRISCGANMTTKSSRSMVAADCVANAGFVLPSGPGQNATQCTGNTYAPPNNRLKACLPCQSGLVVPLSFTGVRSDRNQACQVPPGRFWELNVVRDCPVGQYRSGHLRVTEQLVIACISCPMGWTTTSTASPSLSACSKLLPGFMVNGTDLGGQPVVAINPADSNFAPPTAVLCPRGYFYDGIASNVYGCKACPFQSLTRVNGSISDDDCLVPPGWYARTSNGIDELAKCPTTGSNDEEGYYRPGWAQVKDVVSAAGSGTDVCIKCGSGILSEAVDTDEHPSAASTAKVAATTSSCYIKPGWGMSVNPRNLTTYMATRPCPANTYGVAAKTNGLFNAPCKACTKNLLSAAASNSFEDCKNPGGFGYTSEGANQCPDNFWAAADVMKPCEPCAEGRVTDYEPGNGTLQDSLDKCKVLPGYGIFDSTSDDPCNPDNPTAATAVKPCPIGFFSVGDTSAVGAPTSNPRCTACPHGQSTSMEASSSCDVCAPGYGRSDTTQQCTLCEYNSYHPGEGNSCIPCPRTVFRDFVGRDHMNSTGITVVRGAISADACIPRTAQLPNPAGDRMALPGSMFGPNNTNPIDLTSSAATEQSINAALITCVFACPVSSCCIAELQRNSTDVACRRAVLTPAASLAAGALAGARMYYKLPPSEFAAASTNNISAKTISSGIYAICNIDTWATEASDGKVGTSTDPTKVEVGNHANWTECTTVAACKARCDASAPCWGFVEVAGKGFALRGGEMSVGGRAFFVSPNGANFPALDTLQWGST